MRSADIGSGNVRLTGFYRDVRGSEGVRDSIREESWYCLTGMTSMSLHRYSTRANDMTTDIITTHFDYHSIDHNLLKLDILGHDDPTMIRTLEEYITSDALENEYNDENPFDATKIPLDDKKVLSLFHDTSALGIKPEDIDGCNLGCPWNPGIRYGFRNPDGTGCQSAVSF